MTEKITNPGISYWFPHQLGAIVSAITAAGLQIAKLEDFPHSIREVEYDIFVGRSAQLPMSSLLQARKLWCGSRDDNKTLPHRHRTGVGSCCSNTPFTFRPKHEQTYRQTRYCALIRSKRERALDDIDRVRHKLSQTGLLSALRTPIPLTDKS